MPIKRIFQSPVLRENGIINASKRQADPQIATLYVRVGTNNAYRCAHAVHIQGPCIFHTFHRGDYPANMAVVEVADGIPVQLLDENDRVVEELV